MVKRCCYGLCNSDSRYPERMKNVTFIGFPKPKKKTREKCLRWIKACGRPDWQFNETRINKDTYICSKHFHDGIPTEEHPDPVPFDFENVKTMKASLKKSKEEYRRLKSSGMPLWRAKKVVAPTSSAELHETELENKVITKEESEPIITTGGSSPSPTETGNGCTDLPVTVKVEDDSDMLEYLETNTEHKLIDVFLSEVKMESDQTMPNLETTGTEGASLHQETFEARPATNDEITSNHIDASLSERMNSKLKENEKRTPSERAVIEVNKHNEPNLHQDVEATSGPIYEDSTQIKIGCDSPTPAAQRSVQLEATGVPLDKEFTQIKVGVDSPMSAAQQSIELEASTGPLHNEATQRKLGVDASVSPVQQVDKLKSTSGSLDEDVSQMELGCDTSEPVAQLEPEIKTECDITDNGKEQQPAESDSVTPSDGVYAMECFVNKNFVQPNTQNWQIPDSANSNLNNVQHCQQQNSSTINSPGNSSYRKILPNNGQNFVQNPPQLFLIGNTVFQTTQPSFGVGNLVSPPNLFFVNSYYPSLHVNPLPQCNLDTVLKGSTSAPKDSGMSSDGGSNQNVTKTMGDNKGSDWTKESEKAPHEAGTDTDLNALGPKKGKCPICHKKVKNLKYHYLQVHEGIRQHECPICRKRFLKPSVLENHMTYHSERNSWLCHICGKQFVAFKTLQHHILTHNKIKRYKCSYCEKTFSQRHTLMLHERIHTGEEPFMCDVCGKSFRAVGNLNVHLRTHSIFPTLKCEKCGKTYNKYKLYRACLRKHYKENESLTESEEADQKESSKKEENVTESLALLPVNDDDELNSQSVLYQMLAK